ncbi:MAG TPA: hypothetical protein VKX28_02030 [Xanthobacteraceae bacterium]|nr:hypothetical protein [Xanthobacteraceae bacterium]
MTHTSTLLETALVYAVLALVLALAVAPVLTTLRICGRLPTAALIFFWLASTIRHVDDLEKSHHRFSRKIFCDGSFAEAKCTP